MTVTSGKFSKLPYLPLRVIASHMDLKDLLTITLMSQQINCAVVFLNYSIQTLKWIVAAPGHFVIHIIQRDQPKIILKLSPEIASKFASSRVLINDQKTEISRNGDIFGFQCGSLDSERLQLFEALANFLMRICKPGIFDFCSNLFIGSIFEHTRKFETFKLTHQKLSVENAKLIFEGIEVDVFRLDKIQICTHEFQVFQLKLRDMDLGSAPWLSGESLKNMKCENLKYSQRHSETRQIQSTDIIHFTKSWLSGELENLKELRIDLPDVEYPKGEIPDFEYKMFHEVDLGRLDEIKREGKFILTRSNGKKAQLKYGTSILLFYIL